MNYCFHCGKGLEQGFVFCPYCGGSQAPSPPAALQVKATMDGGTRGKGIASLVLGIEASIIGSLALYFLLLQILNRSKLFFVDSIESLLLGIYAIFAGALALGSGVAARLLGRKALTKAPDFLLPRIGSILSLVGLISGAIAICFSLIFLFAISLRR